MLKALKVSDEAYEEIEKGRKLAIEKYKKEGNDDMVQALRSMGFGALAGWLIFRGVKLVESGEFLEQESLGE